MSAEKYTREQVEAMEVAPGFEHDNLEGWIPEVAGEAELRDALTITTRAGEKIEAYIFNRRTLTTLAGSWVQYFAPGIEGKQKLSYAEVARLEFGKDRAAGKRWEDWVKAYNEKKAAGQKHELAPEALD
jgi:hypothetical protein